MSISYQSRQGVAQLDAGGERGGLPGKRSVTSGMAPRGQVDDTNHPLLHGVSGGRPLPEDLRATMDASFGFDFSAVRVHEGPHVEAIGAQAYARGNELHFAPGRYDPDSMSGRELIAHELTHVVQQSQGRVAATTQAKGLAVNHDAGLEREADELGARAARGERVGGGGGSVLAAVGAPAQCYAFVGGDQVLGSAQGLDARQQAFVTDDKVRDYTTDDEFKAHASGGTDYLGNVGDDHTWVRFAPDKTNVIGENHTKPITLPGILDAVGSTSFIYEAFDSVPADEAPGLAAALGKSDQETLKERFPKADPRQDRAGEDAFPKIGFSMGMLAVALGGNDVASISTGGKDEYVGQMHAVLIQLAWLFSIDNALRVKAGKATGQAELALAQLHQQSGAAIGTFVGTLDGGPIGDQLTEVAKTETSIVAVIEAFAAAVRDVMFAKVVAGDMSETTAKAADQAADGDGMTATLASARNDSMAAHTRKAIDAGVRYAGFGRNHTLAMSMDDELDGAANIIGIGGGKWQQFTRLTETRAQQAEPQQVKID